MIKFILVRTMRIDEDNLILRECYIYFVKVVKVMRPKCVPSIVSLKTVMFAFKNIRVDYILCEYYICHAFHEKTAFIKGTQPHIHTTYMCVCSCIVRFIGKSKIRE